jgi:hypothetical protein
MIVHHNLLCKPTIIRRAGCGLSGASLQLGLNGVTIPPSDAEDSEGKLHFWVE